MLPSTTDSSDVTHTPMLPGTTDSSDVTHTNATWHNWQQWRHTHQCYLAQLTAVTSRAPMLPGTTDSSDITRTNVTWHNWQQWHHTHQCYLAQLTAMTSHAPMLTGTTDSSDITCTNVTWHNWQQWHHTHTNVTWYNWQQWRHTHQCYLAQLTAVTSRTPMLPGTTDSSDITHTNVTWHNWQQSRHTHTNVTWYNWQQWHHVYQCYLAQLTAEALCQCARVGLTCTKERRFWRSFSSVLLGYRLEQGLVYGVLVTPARLHWYLSMYHSRNHGFSADGFSSFILTWTKN